MTRLALHVKIIVTKGEKNKGPKGKEHDYPIPAHWNGQNWITLYGDRLNVKAFTHAYPITLPELIEPTPDLKGIDMNTGTVLILNKKVFGHVKRRKLPGGVVWIRPSQKKTIDDEKGMLLFGNPENEDTIQFEPLLIDGEYDGRYAMHYCLTNWPENTPERNAMSGLHMKYFVLKPKGKDKFAEASRKAMTAYAEHLLKNVECADDQGFAEELLAWVSDKIWDDFRDSLLSDTEMNLQSEVRQIVDATVKALLSGQQWART